MENTVRLPTAAPSLAEVRQEVGQTLFRELFALEEAIQHASERAAEFSAHLARAPRIANLSRAYGQATVARIAQVVVLLADARGACGTAHEGLERARKDLGVQLMWPFDSETESTPPNKPPPEGMAELISLRAGPTIT